MVFRSLLHLNQLVFREVQAAVILIPPEPYPPVQGLEILPVWYGCVSIA